MRELFPFLQLYRRHIGRLTLGVALAIITLLASIGLLTLSGWFLAASSLAGVAGIYSFNFMLPAAGVRGSAITRTAARYFERLVSHDGTFRVLQHLRVYTFSRIMPLSPAGLARFRQGDLLNRFVADVDTLDHLYLRVISPLAGAAAVILLVTLGLSWLDPALALTLGGIMLAVLLLLPPLFYHAGSHPGREITLLRARWRLQLTHWLSGQSELKIYAMAEDWRHQMDDTEAGWQAAQRRQASLLALSQSLMIAVSGISVCLLLWLAASGVGSQPVPDALVALFVFCALAAFEALGPVAVAFLHLGQVISAAQRVNQVIDQPATVAFLPVTRGSATDAALSLHEVSFHYPQQPQNVLEDLSLTVSSGERIALIGPTGCGKSTLLQLITRARDPDKGCITLGALPLANLDEASLRQRISVVTQRVHLFSQTLRQNLQLAAPESDDRQLAAVLHQVGLEKLLTDDDGLDAWMGEGGRSLSGGELRRLAIARALLHNGDVWLLDEPLEGLDAATEQHILHLLNQSTGGKTVIMVTHRLTGLEQMDRICVMESGQIIEQGTHQALLQKQGRYWRFRQRFAL